jgi:hypothetical protein
MPAEPKRKRSGTSNARTGYVDTLTAVEHFMSMFNSIVSTRPNSALLGTLTINATAGAVSFVDHIECALRLTLMLLSIILTLIHVKRLRTPQPPKDSTRIPPTVLLCVLCACVCASCTMTRSATFDAASGEQTTRASAFTLFTSSQSVAGLCARAPVWSNSTARAESRLSGVEQQSSEPTNIWTGIGQVVGAALKAAQ